MKRWMLMAVATLSVAACTEKGILEPREPNARPRETIFWYPAENIFGSATPTQVLDATGGWEVGTVFTTDDTVLVTGFRFYKASGETGTHTVNLWTSDGTKLAFKTFTSETSSGWQSASLATTVQIPAGTYVVSFNTNTYQGKTPSYGFPVYRTHLTATGGRWVAGVGNFPTNNSASAFFADLTVRAKLCNDVIDNPCP
jgi:hypothetical protein